MAKALWHVRMVMHNGMNKFIACKRMNSEGPMNLDNVEFAGNATYTIEAAQTLADYLNSQEEQKAV